MVPMSGDMLELFFAMLEMLKFSIMRWEWNREREIILGHINCLVRDTHFGWWSVLLNLKGGSCTSIRFLGIVLWPGKNWGTTTSLTFQSSSLVIYIYIYQVWSNAIATIGFSKTLTLDFFLGKSTHYIPNLFII